VVAVRLRSWSYLAGLVAVVLFVIGAILMFDGPTDSSPAKMDGGNDATYQILVTGGGAALATLIFAVAAAIFGYGMLPRWTGWFGVIAGIAAIFSVVFFTMLVWLLWIAVVSVLLFIRLRASPAASTATA
jgi:hypothetical protein